MSREDDDLTFGDWQNTHPAAMKNWSERKLLECQRVSRNEMYSGWAQAELNRRRNEELKQQIRILKDATEFVGVATTNVESATNDVHKQVAILAASSGTLKTLTSA